MHWVDRGPAPPSLGQVRTTLTPGWVQHYCNHVGERPSDSRWQDFSGDLSSRFHGICGYCEEAVTLGGVDHFRPKSKFPDLVYAWSNWVFACNSCNHAKNDQWPRSGYVDPCPCSCEDLPESFFDFDLRTGMIVAKGGMTQERRKKALQTIQDLGLNNISHIQGRLGHIEFVRGLLTYLNGTLDLDLEGLVMSQVAPNAAFSSVTRAALAASGYPVEPD